MTMRAIIAVAAALASMTPALAETLTCSTWQDIRTWQDGHGYVSHETQWQDRTYGSDSDGTRWSTSRWQGFTTTTVTPPPDRR
jgi:hypothetical protein